MKPWLASWEAVETPEACIVRHANGGEAVAVMVGDEGPEVARLIAAAPEMARALLDLAQGPYIAAHLPEGADDFVECRWCGNDAPLGGTVTHEPDCSLAEALRAAGVLT